MQSRKILMIMIIFSIASVNAEKECFCKNRIDGYSLTNLQLDFLDQKGKDSLETVLNYLVAKYNAVVSLTKGRKVSLPELKFVGQGTSPRYIFNKKVVLGDKHVNAQDHKTKKHIKTTQDAISFQRTTEMKRAYSLGGARFYLYYHPNQMLNQLNWNTVWTSQERFYDRNKKNLKKKNQTLNQPFHFPKRLLFTRKDGKITGIVPSKYEPDRPLVHRYTFSHYLGSQFEFDVCINFAIFINKMLRKYFEKIMTHNPKTKLPIESMNYFMTDSKTGECLDDEKKFNLWVPAKIITMEKAKLKQIIKKGQVSGQPAVPKVLRDSINFYKKWLLTTKYYESTAKGKSTSVYDPSNGLDIRPDFEPDASDIKPQKPKAKVPLNPELVKQAKESLKKLLEKQKKKANTKSNMPKIPFKNQPDQFNIPTHKSVNGKPVVRKGTTEEHPSDLDSDEDDPKINAPRAIIKRGKTTNDVSRFKQKKLGINFANKYRVENPITEDPDESDNNSSSDKDNDRKGGDNIPLPVGIKPNPKWFGQGTMTPTRDHEKLGKTVDPKIPVIKRNEISTQTIDFDIPKSIKDQPIRSKTTVDQTTQTDLHDGPNPSFGTGKRPLVVENLPSMEIVTHKVGKEVHTQTPNTIDGDSIKIDGKTFNPVLKIQKDKIKLITGKYPTNGDVPSTTGNKPYLEDPRVEESDQEISETGSLKQGSEHGLSKKVSNNGGYITLKPISAFKPSFIEVLKANEKKRNTRNQPEIAEDKSIDDPYQLLPESQKTPLVIQKSKSSIGKSTGLNYPYEEILEPYDKSKGDDNDKKVLKLVPTALPFNKGLKKVINFDDQKPNPYDNIVIPVIHPQSNDNQEPKDVKIYPSTIHTTVGKKQPTKIDSVNDKPTEEVLNEIPEDKRLGNLDPSKNPTAQGGIVSPFLKSLNTKPGIKPTSFEVVNPYEGQSIHSILENHRKRTQGLHNPQTTIPGNEVNRPIDEKYEFPLPDKITITDILTPSSKASKFNAKNLKIRHGSAIDTIMANYDDQNGELNTDIQPKLKPVLIIHKWKPIGVMKKLGLTPVCPIQEVPLDESKMNGFIQELRANSIPDPVVVIDSKPSVAEIIDLEPTTVLTPQEKASIKLSMNGIQFVETTPEEIDFGKEYKNDLVLKTISAMKDNPDFLENSDEDEDEEDDSHHEQSEDEDKEVGNDIQDGMKEPGKSKGNNKLNSIKSLGSLTGLGGLNEPSIDDRIETERHDSIHDSFIDHIIGDQSKMGSKVKSNSQIKEISSLDLSKLSSVNSLESNFKNPLSSKSNQGDQQSSSQNSMKSGHSDTDLSYSSSSAKSNKDGLKINTSGKNSDESILKLSLLDQTVLTESVDSLKNKQIQDRSRNSKLPSEFVNIPTINSAIQSDHDSKIDSSETSGKHSSSEDSDDTNQRKGDNSLIPDLNNNRPKTQQSTNSVFIPDKFRSYIDEDLSKIYSTDKVFMDLTQNLPKLESLKVPYKLEKKNYQHFDSVMKKLEDQQYNSEQNPLSCRSQLGPVDGTTDPLMSSLKKPSSSKNSKRSSLKNKLNTSRVPENTPGPFMTPTQNQIKYLNYFYKESDTVDEAYSWYKAFETEEDEKKGEQEVDDIDGEIDRSIIFGQEDASVIETKFGNKVNFFDDEDFRDNKFDLLFNPENNDQDGDEGSEDFLEGFNPVQDNHENDDNSSGSGQPKSNSHQTIKSGSISNVSDKSALDNPQIIHQTQSGSSKTQVKKQNPSLSVSSMDFSGNSLTNQPSHGVSGSSKKESINTSLTGSIDRDPINDSSRQSMNNNPLGKITRDTVKKGVNLNILPDSSLDDSSSSRNTNLNVLKAKTIVPKIMNPSDIIGKSKNSDTITNGASDESHIKKSDINDSLLSNPDNTGMKKMRNSQFGDKNSGLSKSVADFKSLLESTHTNRPEVQRIPREYKQPSDVTDGTMGVINNLSGYSKNPSSKHGDNSLLSGLGSHYNTNDNIKIADLLKDVSKGQPSQSGYRTNLKPVTGKLFDQSFNIDRINDIDEEQSQIISQKDGLKKESVISRDSKSLTNSKTQQYPNSLGVDLEPLDTSTLTISNKQSGQISTINSKNKNDLSNLSSKLSGQTNPQRLHHGQIISNHDKSGTQTKITVNKRNEDADLNYSYIDQSLYSNQGASIKPSINSETVLKGKMTNNKINMDDISSGLSKTKIQHNSGKLSHESFSIGGVNDVDEEASLIVSRNGGLKSQSEISMGSKILTGSKTPQYSNSFIKEGDSLDSSKLTISDKQSGNTLILKSKNKDDLSNLSSKLSGLTNQQRVPGDQIVSNLDKSGGQTKTTINKRIEDMDLNASNIDQSILSHQRSGVKPSINSETVQKSKITNLKIVTDDKTSDISVDKTVTSGKPPLSKKSNDGSSNKPSSKRSKSVDRVESDPKYPGLDPDDSILSGNKLNFDNSLMSEKIDHKLYHPASKGVSKVSNGNIQEPSMLDFSLMKSSVKSSGIRLFDDLELEVSENHKYYAQRSKVSEVSLRGIKLIGSVSSEIELNDFEGQQFEIDESEDDSQVEVNDDLDGLGGDEMEDQIELNGMKSESFKSNHKSRLSRTMSFKDLKIAEDEEMEQEVIDELFEGPAQTQDIVVKSQSISEDSIQSHQSHKVSSKIQSNDKHMSVKSDDHDPQETTEEEDLNPGDRYDSGMEETDQIQAAKFGLPADFATQQQTGEEIRKDMQQIQEDGLVVIEDIDLPIIYDTREDTFLDLEKVNHKGNLLQKGQPYSDKQFRKHRPNYMRRERFVLNLLKYYDTVVKDPKMTDKNPYMLIHSDLSVRFSSVPFMKGMIITTLMTNQYRLVRSKIQEIVKKYSVLTKAKLTYTSDNKLLTIELTNRDELPGMNLEILRLVLNKHAEEFKKKFPHVSIGKIQEFGVNL